MPYKELPEIDYSNPASEANASSLKLFYHGIHKDSEWRKWVAVSEALNLMNFCLDEEVLAVLENMNSSSQLYTWSWMYGALRGWFNRRDWERALSWDNPALCMIALQTIGGNSFLEYTDLVRLLGPHAPTDDGQACLDKCLMALDHPELASTFYRWH